MVVYCATNMINGKVYIGQTSQSFERRVSAHINRAKRNDSGCSYFYNAIRKYGSDNFQWEVIAESDNRIALDKYEIYYIKSYDSMYPNGYNLQYGGVKNKVYSEESRRKMSESQKKVIRKPEWYIESTRKRTGSKRSHDAIMKTAIANTGMKRTEETKRNISLSKIGKPLKSKRICINCKSEYIGGNSSLYCCPECKKQYRVSSKGST